MTNPQEDNFSFTDEGDAISPRWWNGPNGTKIRYPMAVMYNTLASAIVYDIYAGLPNEAPVDAYPWASADRQIDQGPTESNPHFLGRLNQWLERSQYYGSPTGVLLAMLGATDPTYPTVQTVTNQSATSIWNTYSTHSDPFPTTQSAATPPVYTIVAYNWDWDSLADPFSLPTAWWRAWVLIFSVSGPWSAPTKTLGGFSLGDGTSINWAGNNSDATSLVALANKWRAAHNTIVSVIVSYTSTTFDYTKGYHDASLPDGYYGHWGRIAAAPTSATARTDYHVGTSGGYASVYLPTPTVSSGVYSYGSAYVPARTIGPASYLGA